MRRDVVKQGSLSCRGSRGGPTFDWGGQIEIVLLSGSALEASRDKEFIGCQSNS